ncbi:MAG: hypothetical protein H0X01_00195 [Nitrospira sp.]|nr:hypothetical protein [Nitrospira sp.]
MEVPQTSPLSIEVPFNEKDFENYSAKGQSSITGVAFGRTGGGEIVCSYHVYLFPHIEYTAQWIQQVVENHGPVVPTDKRLEPYTRTTRTDPTCNFWFYHLPAGRYFLTGVIGYKSGGSKRIYGFVELEKGEHQHVIVGH